MLVRHKVRRVQPTIYAREWNEWEEGDTEVKAWAGEDPLDDCPRCKAQMHQHGRLVRNDEYDGHKVSDIVVCPGDWIIYQEGQPPFPIKPEKFAQFFEFIGG